MDEDQAYDDIPVTEEAPEQPAQAQQAPAFDPERFAASIAEGVAKSLAPVLEKIGPKPEPQRPRGLGESLRARVRDELGLDDDVADRYARAAALDALGDEWGDDPAIKTAIKQRTGDARLIEALAEQGRRYRALEERMNKRESEEQARAKRAAELAQLEQLAASGGLRKVAPNLFAGQMTDEHKALLNALDVETLDRILPVIDKLVGNARPPSRRLASAPGGTGREKHRPVEIVDDAKYDEMVQRALMGEEMN